MSYASRVQAMEDAEDERLERERNMGREEVADYSDAASCQSCGVWLGGRAGIGASYCWNCRNGANAAAVPQKAEPMKVNDAFPSTYLKQSDLGGKRVLVTIDHVKVEDVGQGADQERKPVVYFRKAEKGMVLNRGNADSITSIVGDDETDNWGGHQVVLYVDPSVMFGGKRVGGIRVAAPPAGHGKPSAPPPPPPEIVDGFEAGDDDVPF